ncbi:major royal jelly protein 1-like [Physella acuta]|uniref:major royal jelly protein 1-like n=1 Tax=Physella acuta TaxID=109671 RepID=UPI0027DC5C09|nr:major royal jelly protein 1-like [Physella acuta]
MTMLLSVLLGTILLQTVVVRCEVEFEFLTIDWVWPNTSMRDEYIARGDYDPKLCHLSAIQVDDFNSQTKVFVTAPRLKEAKGVPSGLNTVEHLSPDSKTGILRPFPDWETNKLGDCNALQLPMSIAIDPRTGYLYVIDVGRVGVTSDHPSNLCPPKLVVFNTRAGGLLVRSHEFPDSVVSRSTNFLNDIVLDYVDLDHPTGVRYAYISDTKAEQIVVFDFSTNETWSFNDISMSADEDSNITINGVLYQWPFGINGIAISPSFNYVYYSALGSKKLWQIPTWVLRNKNANFLDHVRTVGSKVDNSDAMVFGKQGLYYGALSKNAVYVWDAVKDAVSQGVSEGELKLQTERQLIQNSETIQWPDGIALSGATNNQGVGSLYFVSARAQLFHAGTLDISGAQGINFRIFKIPVNDVSALSEQPSDTTYPPVIVG